MRFEVAHGSVCELVAREKSAKRRRRTTGLRRGPPSHAPCHPVDEARGTASIASSVDGSGRGRAERRSSRVDVQAVRVRGRGWGGAVVRERVQLGPAAAAEHRDERRSERCNVADRPHAHAVQRRRCRADAPQRARPAAAGGMRARAPAARRASRPASRRRSRPWRGTCPRDPDRDGQLDAPAHVARSRPRSPAGVPARRPCRHIQERLVDRQPLDERRRVPRTRTGASRLRVR